jgi:hypothetical protein
MSGEFFEQIGDAVQILAIGKTGKFDTGRLGTAQTCFTGIKRIVNILRHIFGVFAGAGAGLIIRHVSLDVTREPFQRTLSLKRIFEFAFHTFAIFPVALGALLLENLRPAQRARARLKCDAN